jgi:YegS/Rv2252/BmrU family lipid kinase
MTMADQGRTRIIVNPSGGGGRASQRVADIKTLLDEAWPFVDWRESRSARHLTDLCLDAAAAQFTRVVVVGGDGTIHHAVRGLANTATALGIIPSGTGNDFAAAAGIPTHPVAAARMLLDCSATPVDLGAVDDIPFCCVAGVGMDTPALQYINSSRIKSRQLLYHLAAVRTLIRYAPRELSIEVNDETIRDRVLFAAFSNTPTYAGGSPVAPQASIFDAKLDYCVFLGRPLLQRAMTFMQMRRGRHLGRPGVRSGVANAVRIDSAAPVPITMDGELTPLTTPAHIRLLPGALQLICPGRVS